MIPKICLKRSLDVRCWRVIGQVAQASKRPDLIPILMRVDELMWSDADDIASHLFFERQSRKVVAERMLRIASHIGLLEERGGYYTLTEQGSQAITSDQVFVPEYGSWTIWAVNDPLLGPRVLRVEVWEEPVAFNEVLGPDRDARRTFEHLPQWLNELQGFVQRPCAGAGGELRLDGLEDRGEAVTPHAKLTVVWDVSAGRLRVEGALAGCAVNAELEPPERSHTEVWQELLEGEGLWESWDGSREALCVGFDDTTDAEREPMLRRLRIEQPRVRELGCFDAVEIEGVGLAARSRADAQRWARWRLDSRISDYATTARFGEWRRAACEPFEGFQVVLPDRSELVQEAWEARGARPSPRAWHLAAAQDWRL